MGGVTLNGRGTGRIQLKITSTAIQHIDCNVFKYAEYKSEVIFRFRSNLIEVLVKST